MNDKAKIEELLKASADGTITAAQVTEAGLHRSVLQELVKSGEMYRFGRGLYVQSSAWEDDFYLLQRKYGRGIYVFVGVFRSYPCKIYNDLSKGLQYAVLEAGKPNR